MFKRILMATDGSEASDHAARLAVDLARVHGASLTALYVVDPYPFLGMGEVNPLGFDAYMAAAREQATQAHARILEACTSGESFYFEAAGLEIQTAFRSIASNITMLKLTQ